MASLPTDKQARKDMPMARGLLDYFPLALAAVAEVSRVGNEQHNPGQPMHWSKHLSTDHADCIIRHLVDRGTVDSDGLLHSAKIAWRALALLEIELEGATVEHSPQEIPKPTFEQELRRGFDVVTKQPCACHTLSLDGRSHSACYGGNAEYYCKDQRKPLH